MFGQEWPTLLAAVLVAIIGTARLTRLLAEDDWPPAAWFRTRWISAFNGTGWDGLILCVFCISPYLAAANVAWAVLSDLHWAWWLFNGWLALAYLSAIITTRDLPADQRDL
jgi:hypothetical protein